MKITYYLYKPLLI